MGYQLIHGDCLDAMAGMEDNSIDAVISDPPYPEIDRQYGRMTEAAWMDMMQEVVRQSRRILKPTGSAVFILQPNSEKVGKMRLWLWEFMLWAGKEWGIVQDAYWWNYAALPAGGATTCGLLRSSIKACIWIGDACCYRCQDAVLWDAGSDHNAVRFEKRSVDSYPSGHRIDRNRMSKTKITRGGVTPFNLLPVANNNQAQNDAGAHGHGAGTPLKLADWWTRYICPPGGTVCDPFNGSGTMGIAAINNGCNYIGIEKMPEYYEISKMRLDQALLANSVEPVRVAGKATDLDALPLFAV